MQTLTGAVGIWRVDSRECTILSPEDMGAGGEMRASSTRGELRAEPPPSPRAPENPRLLCQCAGPVACKPVLRRDCPPGRVCLTVEHFLTRVMGRPGRCCKHLNSDAETGLALNSKQSAGPGPEGQCHRSVSCSGRGRLEGADETLSVCCAFTGQS